MIRKILKRLSRGLLLSLCILGIVASGAMLFESYIYDYKGASVVKITRSELGRSGGTGFQVKTPSGKQFTLTNAHICKMGNSLVAHKQDGESQRIKVVKIYNKHDLCIMEPVDGLRPLRIATSLQLHERVWLIGHPALRSLTLESGHYVGNTNINLITPCSKKQLIENRKKLEKMLKEGFTPENIEDLFQLMIGICTKKISSQHINNIAYGGNSGSPVVNKYGNVIGVLFAGRRDQPTASHTVPISEIQEFLKNK